MFVYINAFKYLCCYQISKIYLNIQPIESANLFLKINKKYEHQIKRSCQIMTYCNFYFIATTEKKNFSLTNYFHMTFLTFVIVK